METSRLTRFLVIPLLVFVLAGPTHAQQAEVPLGQTVTEADLAAEEVNLLADLRIDGEYDSALAKGRKLLETRPKDEAVVAELVRTLLEVGKYSEAIGTCEALLAEVPRGNAVRILRAQALLEVGRGREAYDEIQKVLLVDPGNLRAGLIQGRILEDRGERDRAREVLSGVVGRADSIQDPSADDLTVIGQASTYLALAQRNPGMLKTVAGRIYPAAFRKDSRNLEARTVSGNLFASKYQYQEAAEDFKAALQVNPHYVPALVGLAESRISQRMFAEAQENLEDALTVNPNCVSAHALLALLDLYDEETDDALKELEAALAVNPNDLSALSLKAACYWQLSRRQSYQETETHVLGLNARCGQFYSTVAGICISRHQDAEAEKLLVKAAELSPNDSGPATDLGLLYMRQGDEKAARQWLEKAWDMDTFNVLTYNTLNLLDKTAQYKTIETEHFTIRIDPTVDAVLAEYVPAYLEEIHKERVKQFKYEPGRKCLVEFFPKHQYFSVRTTGIPFIGTVGACLGPVIAMDSPRAAPPGAFNWGRVLKHEYTHVVNLNMTEGRISHWLTEGFAVYCEQSPRPYEWHQLLVDAVAHDELLPLSKLSQGFTRSRTQRRRQLAYAESGLVVEYVVGKYGWEPLLTLMEKYHQRKTTAEGVEETFKVTLGDFEKDFKKHVKDMASKWPLKPTPRVRDADEVASRLAENPEDMDARLELARIRLRRRDTTGALIEVRKVLARNPVNPDALVVEAYVRLAQRNPDEAGKILTKALTVSPKHRNALWGMVNVLTAQRKPDQVEPYLVRLLEVEPDNPAVYQRLAAAAEGRKDATAAEKHLLKAAELDVSDLRSRARLAKIYIDRKDYARACPVADEMIRIWPYDRQTHEWAERAYRQTGNAERADLEKRVLDAMGPKSEPAPETGK